MCWFKHKEHPRVEWQDKVGKGYICHKCGKKIIEVYNEGYAPMDW